MLVFHVNIAMLATAADSHARRYRSAAGCRSKERRLRPRGSWPTKYNGS